MYETKPRTLPSQKVVGIEKDENLEDLLREEAEECSSLKNEGILKKSFNVESLLEILTINQKKKSDVLRYRCCRRGHL